jgi:hypothetical protein
MWSIPTCWVLFWPQNFAQRQCKTFLRHEQGRLHFFRCSPGRQFRICVAAGCDLCPWWFLSTSFSVQGVFGMFARYSQDKGTCVHICIMYVSLVCCQAVFRNIADTYGIFNDGTMRRVTKETLHANKQGIIQTLHVNKQGKTQQVKRPANYFCVCVCVSGLGFFYCWPSPEHGNACLISGWKVRRIKARQNKFKQVYI